MDQAILGPRARNKIRIRHEITEAAFELFVERGFEHTSVEDIIGVANISRRTFYRYFASVGDILQSWDNEISAQLRESVLARPPGEMPLVVACKALQEVFRTYETTYARGIALSRVMGAAPKIRSQRLESSVNWRKGLVAALMERFGAEISPLIAEVSAGLTVAIARAATDYWLAESGVGDFKSILDETFATSDGLYAERLVALAADASRRRRGESSD